jgi:hypothetical protein
MHSRVLLALVWMLGLIGCSSVSEPEYTRSIGVIQSESEMVDVIETPDTVDVGMPFQATINTFGSSSCTIPDGLDLTLTDNLAVITPYDRSPGRDVPCTADYAPRPHPIELRFTVPGQAAIQVIGYRFGDGQRVLTSISRSVAVRP